MWSIHHPGLYLMKYFSMLSPEDMAEDVNDRYPSSVDHPPSRPQKPYLSGETFLFHIVLLSQVLKKPDIHPYYHSR